jgi:hypothetical protein
MPADLAALVISTSVAVDACLLEALLTAFADKTDAKTQRVKNRDLRGFIA